MALVSLAVAPAAIACVNTFASEIHLHLLNQDRAGAEELVAELEAKYRQEPILENYNDAAVGRLLIGDLSRAIELLKETESKFPGKAIVAANLGTAYELSGKPEEALRWISEGVKRDPKEHFGTEWLHVKILEAKLAVAKDPAWLKTHSVMGIDVGIDARPTRLLSLPSDHEGRLRSLTDMRRAIQYQLNEREQFVDKPDAVIADLYLTEGDLLWLIGQPATWEMYSGAPEDSYEEALAWGPVKEDLTKLRLRTFAADYPDDIWMPESPKQVSTPKREPAMRIDYGRTALLIAGVILVIGSAWFLGRRSRATKP